MNIAYIAEKIKLVINVEELLNDLGADIKRKTKNELQFKCLNPNHRDRNASSFYNIDKHQFNCLGCSYSGSLFSLIMLVKSCSYEKSVEFLKEYTKLSDDISDDVVLSKMLSIKKKTKETSKLKEIDLPLEFDNDFNKCNKSISEYIIDREINPEIIKKYYIGYCNTGRYRNRLILPIIHFDKIVGFSARATWDCSHNTNIDERYLFESDSPVGKVIWGLFNNYSRNNAIFVEGIFDALRLRQHGLNAFSCLNNDITEFQIKLIATYFNDPIYIMPDNDVGGQNMIKNFHKKIFNKFNIKVSFINTKDPDELDYISANDSFKNAINILDITNNTKFDETTINRLIRRI